MTAPARVRTDACQAPSSDALDGAEGSRLRNRYLTQLGIDSRPLARVHRRLPSTAEESGEATSLPGELERVPEDAAAMVNYWWSVQSGTEAHVAPAEHGGQRAEVHPDSISMSATRLARGGGASTEANLTVDRTGLSASVEHRDHARSLSVGGYAAPGWVEVDTSGLWNLAAERLWGSADAGTLGVASSLAGWTDFVGAGLEVDLGLTALLSLCVGVFSSLSCEREATYLGPYQGTCAELQGLHAVEIDDARGRWSSLYAGLNPGGLGLGLTGNARNARSAVFRTHVSLDAARDVLLDDPGALEKMARNLRRALGGQLEGLAAPDVSRPLETLGLHDEVRFVTERETQGLFLLGAKVAKVGVVGTTGGRFEITVRRLPPVAEGRASSRVEVSIRLVELRQIGLFGSVAPGLGVDGTLNLSLAKKETFAFSLDEPGAGEAFRRTLAGRLPLTDAGALPRGVRRTFVERVELRGRGAYVGTKVFFLTVGSDYAGLSRSSYGFAERLVATDGQVTVDRQTYGARSQREFLVFGQTERSVFASHRRVLVSGGDQANWRFAGVLVRAVLSDTRVAKNGQNAGMVDVLNALFDTRLARFERPGRRQSREVVLERVLAEPDIAALSDPDEGRLTSAAARTRVPARKLRALSRELSQTPVELAAKHVARFVARHGLEGFAALHHLRDGAPEKLALRTTSSAYSKPVGDARELMVLWSRAGTSAALPKRPGAPRDLLVRAAQTLRAIEDGILDLADDPFVASGAGEDGPDREPREPRLALLRLARGDVEDLMGGVTAPEIAGLETAALEAVHDETESLLATREASDAPFPARAARVVATVRTELAERRARVQQALTRRLEDAGFL